jgi:23S rRNA (uracil1939-C5)-methyltransferase
MQIKIEKLVYGGAGIARTEEGVIFVSKVLPGELVEVEITDRKKDYANARLVEVIEPSPHRKSPVCPNFSTVGCCSWDYIAYNNQTEIKESIIRDSLSRLGHIEWDHPIDRITGIDRGYRMRAKFHVENHRMGFVREQTHQFVPITECGALMPALNTFIGEANAALRKPGLGKTESVHAIASPETGEVAATFHGGRERASWTDRLPRTRVMGIEYRLRPDSFFQPNQYLVKTMASEVMAATEGSKVALDLFCGSGFFSLLIARQTSRVIGIDRRSIANAQWNAQRNEIRNVEFIKAAAWAFLMKAQIKPDTVVLDPPRTGAGKGIVHKVIALEPAKVVYVSCNPSTFAPEARLLMDGGYKLSSFKFVDQFPHTHHIETIAVFERLQKN